jgi:hypothetical protein
MPLRNSFKFFTIAVSIFIFTVESNADERYEKVLEVGEMLKYEVSYGFIKLGEVTFTLTNKRKREKKTVYNAKLQVKTYPEIPFVKLNEIMETEMELEETDDYWNLFSRKFYETKFDYKSIKRTEYNFDYDAGVIKVLTETDNVIEKNQVIAIGENIHFKDRITWNYNCRLHSFSNRNFNVPVFINDEATSIRYSYNLNKTVVNIEMFDYEISVIKLEGTADYTDLFGFTGEFLIMFSADDYRVPIKLYFDSALGNLIWELKDYKKLNWKPPAYFSGD